MPNIQHLPEIQKNPGRTGDIARFYSAPNTKYTGKASDHQSIITHQRIYYNQCPIAGMSALEGLHCLIHMIDMKSIAGFYYMNNVFDQVETLEDAFAMLLKWSKETTQSSIFLREWRSLKIEDFKNSDISLKKQSMNYMRELQLFKICLTGLINILIC